MTSVLPVIVSLNTFLLLIFVRNIEAALEGYNEEIKIPQGNIVGRMRLAGRVRSGPDRYIAEMYYEFLGIPYAQPPVGPLRYKSPQPASNWKGSREALTPGPACLQSFFSKVRGSEDCLYLNVYIPDLPRGNFNLKPVMVWIHGGAFKIGNGYDSFGPEYLVSKKILLVTLNYRLGVLGFLSLDNDKLSGNFGIKDQIQALRWVKENIAYFGGDPHKVTVFGSSAGAASIQYLIFSPLAKGLFHQAIIQSGTALSSWAYNPHPKKTALKLARTMGFNSSNVDKLHDFFMNATAKDLTLASDVLLSKEFQDISNFNAALFVPCAENVGSGEKVVYQLPDETVRYSYESVPTIIGTLDADGSVLFTAKNLSNKDFETLNKNSGWAVPYNWNILPGKDKEKVGKQIKDYFFGEKPVSFNTFNSLVEFYTDSYFLMDVQQTLAEHLEQSHHPIYVYEFTLPTSRSNKFMVNLLQGRDLDIKGAAHSDELPLLFSPTQNITVPGLKYNSSLLDKEEEIADKMLLMWTNFAKTGDPNSEELGVKWKPVTENNLSYLKIGSDLKVIEGRAQGERLKFWRNLCKKTYTTTYRCENL